MKIRQLLQSTATSVPPFLMQTCSCTCGHVASMLVCLVIGPKCSKCQLGASVPAHPVLLYRGLILQQSHSHSFSKRPACPWRQHHPSQQCHSSCSRKHSHRGHLLWEHPPEWHCSDPADSAVSNHSTTCSFGACDCNGLHPFHVFCSQHRSHGIAIQQ